MHRRLGGPLPRQLANAPHAHPSPINLSSFNHAIKWLYRVLDAVSHDYPLVTGRLHTCYSPVRRSPADKASFIPDAPRLACVRPVASVHPEPGSNSPLFLCYFNFCSYYLGSLRLSYLLSPKVYTLKIINQGLQPTEIGFRSKVLSFSLCFLFPVYRKHFNVLTLLLGCSPSLWLFLKSECKINTFFWITKTFTLK